MLWIGTVNTGLDRIDRRTGQVVHSRPLTTTAKLRLPLDLVYSAGSTGALARYAGRPVSLDPATGAYTGYRHDPSNPNSLSDDTIFGTQFDRSGIPG